MATTQGGSGARRASPGAASGRSSRLGESLHEVQGGVGDLAPAAVDRERVPAVGYLDDLGHPWVALLALERGVRDGPRHGVVLLAVDDQQRPSLRILGVDLRLGPGI